jgi:translation initiation factor 2B subunit (eIF-2B alpha/beta/delta family)/ADP-ribose pyrophosphatase YjhB (NUDIX family)
MTDDELEETHVVTVFLRHEGAILLLRRSADVGSYSGQWGAVAGHAEGDPDAAARQEIREETGLDPTSDVTLVRAGESFEVADGDLGRLWVVHPYLFEAATREIEPNYETADAEWVAPTEILRRETVPDLWTSYDRVRPTVETVAGDREHGSTYLSVRALETLRDEAGIAAERGERREGEESGESGWPELVETARALRDARPSMPVVANRVNRAMNAASDERSPDAVETAAQEGIERALAVDDDAARRVADRLPARVATLSRSGTVYAALVERDPETVLVAESRPGREGVGVAERLARETDAAVTLTTDAALAEQLAVTGVETVLVGADAVTPDGSVLNKVGTRGTATVANREGIDCLVVAASDKVLPASTGDEPADPAQLDREERDPAEVYDGDSDGEPDGTDDTDTDVAVANPTFDLTPADRVDAVVTEDGVLDTAAVRDLAERHRERANWG